MINLKSSRSETSYFKNLQRKPWNFQEQPFKKLFWKNSQLILAVRWTIWMVWTISVSLWTITIINFNRALVNLDAMDNFNFTNFHFLLLQSVWSEESLADKFH